MVIFRFHYRLYCWTCGRWSEVPRRINIPDPQELLRHIAGMYQSATRVIMEYIDNSLDDAESFYDEEGSYPYLIEITVDIDTGKREISITDNCCGMTREKLVRIVEYVGSSDKKAQPWTNGQFGFGVHAFRACCKKLEIITKAADDNPWRMLIDRDSNEVPDEENLPPRAFPFPSGTIIKLSKFDGGWWKEVNPKELVNEIELHFNHLLRRERLNIQVVEGNRVYICKPYDIGIFNGSDFEYVIERARDGKQNLDIILPRPIEIHLKVCENPFPDKPPLFLNMGRRIEEVAKMKSYYNLSPYKGKVWAHPHLIGYIEINGNLDPTLDRSDFKRTRKRRAVYESIALIEEDIHSALSKIVQSTNAESLGRLGSLLTRLLEQIAKEDRMTMREVLAAGGEVSLSEVSASDLELASPGAGDGVAGQEGGEPGGERTSVEEGDGDLSGRRRRGSGFVVRFDDTALDALIQEDGTIPRASLVEDTINIYVNHPDFMERTQRGRHGRMRLSDRLASYIASIIAIYYKDTYYSKYNLQPEIRRVVGSRTAMFDDFLSFTCRLEKMLQEYVGSDLEKIAEV
jgi:hypothetical protein